MTHIYHRNAFVRVAFLLAVVLAVVASLYTISTRPALGDSTEVVIADAGTMCQAWLHDFVKPGVDNDPAAVRNVQLFLNTFEGFDVPLTGAYDAPTIDAVKKFQLRYSSEILAPWGIQEPTGYVYLTTRKKINERFCGSLRTFPLTPVETQIIADSHLQATEPAVPSAPGGLTPPGEPSASVPDASGSLADGITLEIPAVGLGSTSPVDTSAGIEEDGRLGTVTPATFVSSLLAGVPNVEVPLVLAIIAAILLLLGGVILFRSFRSHPTAEESMIFGIPTSDAPSTSASETQQELRITERNPSPVAPTDSSQNNNNTIINLPGDRTSSVTPPSSTSSSPSP
jgi:hypothetical protein